MKTKPLFATLLVAAMLGVGIFWAKAAEESAPAASLAEVVEQNKKILENQKKIMDKLEKMDEQILFVKARVMRL